MRPRQLAVSLAVALVAGVLSTTTSASARTPDDRPAAGSAPPPVVVVARDDDDHGPVAVDTNVPAAGSAMVSGPTLGANDKSAKINVQPLGTHDADVFDNFGMTMGSLNSLTKGQKLLACVMIFQFASEWIAHSSGSTVALGYDGLDMATLLLGACLQATGLISTKKTPRASAAGSPCSQFRPSLPATISKTSGGYHLEASGTTAKAKKKQLKTKIRCKETATGVTLTVRPRQKNKTLRQVVGKRLMLGLKSPADATQSVPLRVTFS